MRVVLLHTPRVLGKLRYFQSQNFSDLVVHIFLEVKYMKLKHTPFKAYMVKLLAEDY